MRGVKNLSFKTKLTVIYIICVFIPLLLMSIFYYNISVSRIEHQQNDNLNYDIEKSSTALSNQFDRIVFISDMLYCNDKLYKLLDLGKMTLSESLDASNQIEEFCTYFKSNTFINSVNIYSDNPNLLRGSALVKTGDIPSGSVWYNEYLKSNSGTAVISYYSPDYNSNVVSYIQRLDYIKTKNGSNFLKIDILEKEVYNVLEQNSNTSNLYFIKSDDSIIAGCDRTDGGYKNYLRLTGDFKVFEFSFPNGYKIAGSIDKSRTPNVFTSEVILFALIIIFSIILAFFALYKVIYPFTKKLVQLTVCTKNMINGTFELVPEENVGSDEIGILTRGMNGAVIRIKQLLKEVVEAKMRELEIEKEKSQAKFQALQSQINPHFMFNILEAVRMGCLVRKEGETAQIIKNMSAIFRWLIDWKDDLITVKDEMIFVNSYIRLQKYYYSDDVEVTMDIDKDAEDALLPKITLQVILENAFVHGVDKSIDKCSVDVKVKKIDQSVLLRVSDSGAGMSKKTVDAINNREFKTVTNRVGLQNVVNRLELYFNDEFEFYCTSEPYKETAFTIKIPFRKN